MIGLIGFGRFGALTAGYLARDFPVFVYSRSRPADVIADVGAESASLEAVCRQAFVVLSVPISAMPRTLQQIAPLLKPNSVVIDVCSVKIHPMQWMRDYLPPQVHILGTHPMFGPDSAADSLEGRKLVLCRERMPQQRYDRVRRYLEGKNLIVIETTPEDHDRQIAISLSLTHFIGRSLSAFGAEALEIDTEGYRRLIYTLGVVQHDSWQLFEDMHRYNPYARQVRTDFMQAMQSIDKKLTPD
ncbi:MAG: prephenate dehydrogenase/arogenate dehydrogenase family protein [Desulfobacterales bacterium]|nr:prephenate dehydrogenase/arogenate dehydrogenase family protein [Desulfobacterales bacterium]MDJ0889012.1 prephenate dehydrogenase/arogenate dehydrogenase family protein [Desulfobacterales bacterium]MDJ0988413.1 prephenate dehydrogenase/arogenate dehydrogenase family protein [Desulfobacterales bacterium]